MSKQTVLLIENDPSSIEGTRQALAASGLNVQIAMDGESGLEAFKQILPDLVIVESMVPKRNGFEVCRAIKSCPQGAKTPVIVTAATYRGDTYRNKALTEFGATEYFEKPLDPSKLVEACLRLMPTAGTPAASAVKTARKKPPKSLALDDLSEDEIMDQLDCMIDALVETSDDTPEPEPSPETLAEKEIDSALQVLIPSNTVPFEQTSPTAFEDAVNSLEQAAVREQPPQPTPRSPAPWIGLAIIVFLTAAAVGYKLLPGDEPDLPAPMLQPEPAVVTVADPIIAEPEPEPESIPTETIAKALPVVELTTPAAPPLKEDPVVSKPVRRAIARKLITVQTPRHFVQPIVDPNRSVQAVPDLTREALDTELEAIASTPEPPRTVRGALVPSADLDQAPELIERVAPAYPALARRMRQEGVVTLSVLIKSDGSVGEILNPAGRKSSILDRAAIDAVREWKYRPATKDGVEVQTWISVRITFAL